MTPALLWFLVPAVAGPLSVLFIDWTTGYATLAQMASYFDLPFLIAFGVLAGGSIVIFALFLRHFARLAESSPARAFRSAARLPAVVVPWSLVHNVVLSLVMHAGSDPVRDELGLVVVVFYAGAVGIFFGVLFFASAIGVLERRLPIQRVVDGEARPSRSDLRFAATVIPTITAFLFGAAGAAYQSIYGGLTISQAMVRISVIAVPFLLLTAILTRQLSRLIIGPLAQAIPELKRLAQGDLSRRLSTSGISDVDVALAEVNLFTDALATTFADVRRSAGENASFAGTLEATARNQVSRVETTQRDVQQIAGELQSLADRVEGTASATEEISRSIESLNTLIERQNGAITETAAASEELSASTARVVDVSEAKRRAAEDLRAIASDSHTRAQSAVSAVETIAGQVDDLLALNRSIAGLAAQTNLLAMNAAIEAAHAGDAGRGFAVVASEIRALAESASGNARESTDFLKQIVARINEAADAIRTVDDSFNRVDAESASLADSLAEIVGSSREMNQTAEGITNQMSEVTSITRAVGESVAEIGIGADRIAEAAQESRSIGETVTGMMADITSATDELQEQTRRLPEISTSIAETGTRLSGQLSRFTIVDEPTEHA